MILCSLFLCLGKDGGSNGGCFLHPMRRKLDMFGNSNLC